MQSVGYGAAKIHNPRHGARCLLSSVSHLTKLARSLFLSIFCLGCDDGIFQFALSDPTVLEQGSIPNFAFYIRVHTGMIKPPVNRQSRVHARKNIYFL